ncbi:hypothetical protein BG262_04340 [Floricoccus penangensis]|uniref:Bacteriophage abortive infection AbiH n=1 Tax=Floricoccus penangensis TaxID=1859475 RepID=A0A9Q5JFY1_9LACT|nr:AbiH family protein [Floricoccus penangensis]OFI46251.1 hypothetical protein BG262_04340 [Floricoccus penangensis]
MRKSEEFRISFLIGNGFDIKLLKEKHSNNLTTYSAFYEWLKSNEPNKKNIIYNSIRESQNNSDWEKWSDFELGLVNEIIPMVSNPEKNYEIEHFLNDYMELQLSFSKFLNQTVTPELLLAASEIDSEPFLQNFLKDLSEQSFNEIRKPDSRFGKYLSSNGKAIKLKYDFYNFNYTSLLDNYLFNDVNLKPFSSTNNNSKFFHDEVKDKETGWYISRDVNIYHPHGRQEISPSILFGVSEGDQLGTSYDNDLKRFIKSEWINVKSGNFDRIDSTDLFVIMGHSIGESDKWWWKKLAKLMLEKDKPKHLIIYQFGDEKLKENFINCIEKYSDGIQHGFNNDSLLKLEKLIHIIKFTEDNPPAFAFNF